MGKLLLLKTGVIAVIVFTHVWKSTKLVEHPIAVIVFVKSIFLRNLLILKLRDEKCI